MKNESGDTKYAGTSPLECLQSTAPREFHAMEQSSFNTLAPRPLLLEGVAEFTELRLLRT